MITATELKNGKSFILEGKPYQVIKYSFSKIGRGGGTVKLSIRDLKTGNLVEKTFNSSLKFDEIATQKRKLQYLYNDGITATFMDPTTFDQIEITVDVVGDSLSFIKEGETANVLFWENNPLSIEIAPMVTLEIKRTEPGVKGNSATNIYKPAELENGLKVKVPLFIKNGDKIKVDTRTSEYIERVND